MIDYETYEIPKNLSIIGIIVPSDVSCIAKAYQIFPKYGRVQRGPIIVENLVDICVFVPLSSFPNSSKMNRVRNGRICRSRHRQKGPSHSCGWQRGQRVVLANVLEGAQSCQCSRSAFPDLRVTIIRNRRRVMRY